MLFTTIPQIRFSDLRFYLPPEPPPRLALPSGPVPPTPLCLPAPSLQTQRECGLAAFLADIAAELNKRPGVRFEASYIPHAGQFAVRLPSSRNILVATQRLDQLDLTPATIDAQTQRRGTPAWRKAYTVPRTQVATFKAINDLVMRHNQGYLL